MPSEDASRRKTAFAHLRKIKVEVKVKPPPASLTENAQFYNLCLDKLSKYALRQIKDHERMMKLYEELSEGYDRPVHLVNKALEAEKKIFESAKQEYQKHDVRHTKNLDRRSDNKEKESDNKELAWEWECTLYRAHSDGHETAEAHIEALHDWKKDLTTRQGRIRCMCDMIRAQHKRYSKFLQDVEETRTKTHHSTKLAELGERWERLESEEFKEGHALYNDMMDKYPMES